MYRSGRLRIRQPASVLPAQTRAFTLVEVLLVMLIASVMMGMVVMAIPGNVGKGADLQLEAERVLTLLQMAGDEAVVSGNELGFEVREHDYRFYRYDEAESQWIPLVEQPFQERTIPDGIELSLDVDGRRVKLGDAPGAPSVLLLSSGETTPFHLYIRASDGTEKVVATDGFQAIAFDKDAG